MMEVEFGIRHLEQVAPNMHEYFGFSINPNADPKLIYDYCPDHIDQLIDRVALLIKGNDSFDEVYTTLLFLAAILTTVDLDGLRQYYNQEVYDQESVQRDLLKLYIYSKGELPKTEKQQKITFKRFDNTTIKLDNRGNFFVKQWRLIFEKLIPEITSIEQAQSKLDQLNQRKKGRKQTTNHDFKPLIFGIYRLMNDKASLSSPMSDELCRFIEYYLDLVGVNVDKEVLSFQRIRTELRRMITSGAMPMLYTYNDMSFLYNSLTPDIFTSDSKPISLKDMERSGLY